MILLEVSYTRVFSFKLVYYFTYLVIGISLLGLGAGGVFFAISARLRGLDPGRLVLGCCVVGTFAVLLSYFIVALVPLHLFQMVLSIPRGEVLGVGVGWSFAARVALTVGFLSPLGLCLGAFIPLGLRSVSAVTEHGQEYIAWCGAINGFFSVVASVLSTVLSMTFGFGTVMFIGLVIYAIGVAAFLRVPAPTTPHLGGASTAG